MSEHFGRVLKEYRLRKDFSLRSLAKLVNVSFSYINKLEKGKYNPSKKVVIDLANALGVPPNEFLSAAGYLPDKLQSKSNYSTKEEKVLSILRRTNPHIIELIEKASELSEDQQEMVAGHWKWALDVVRRQESYKSTNKQSLNVKEENTKKYKEKPSPEEDEDIDVRSTPMAAHLEDGESVPLTPELEEMIKDGIKESRRIKRERKSQQEGKQEKPNTNDEKDTTDKK